MPVKCTGMNWDEWGFEAIFEVDCPFCGAAVEFFRDETSRRCSACGEMVANPRQDYGCNRDCHATGRYDRMVCPRFRRAKGRFATHVSRWHWQ